MHNIDLFVLIQLIYYLLYRIVRTFILVESDVLALFHRIWDKRNEGVEFFNVVARYRLDCTDIAREFDFLIFHEGFGTAAEISSARWVIYTISEKYVYFVQVPHTAKLSINEYSKMTEYLFKFADKVARMDIDIFIKEFKTASSFKNRVVFLHSSPSCGGTMLGKILQSCDSTKSKVLVLGEPPVFFSISILLHSQSIERMQTMCQAVLRFTMHHYKRDQTILIKTRACCAKIIPFIHSSYPSIQHVFITSKNPMDIIPHLIQVTSKKFPVFNTICELLKYSPILCDLYFGWRLLESETITKVGPKEPFEFALAQLMGSVISYQRSLKYFALDAIYFEDLISNTATVIRPILDICEMTGFTISDCIERERKEECKVRDIWRATPLVEAHRARVKTLVEYLQKDWSY